MKKRSLSKRFSLPLLPPAAMSHAILVKMAESLVQAGVVIKTIAFL
ncbi:MAG: hypothetical protein GIW96_01370 [Candidatus Eremiobacteraeota bacterium]|nr:hypothetical protein [Candidatus Eremiobacteraeota bacterium]